MKVLKLIIAALMASLTATVLNAQSLTLDARYIFYSDMLKAPQERCDTITMRFIGDVMLHTLQIENSTRPNGAWDFTTFLEGIRPELESADLAVANMEFPLGGAPYSGYPVFSTPDEYADYIADCGVDIMLLANNHILDKGYSGMKRTLKYYDKMESERNILYTGCANPGDTTRNPLLLVVKGVKLALVNYTYGTNLGDEQKEGPRVFRQDETSLKQALARAKAAGADLIIALPHWGTEYQTTHSSSQEKWAKMLAENGADVIIGSHPHVVQDYGTVKTSDGRLVPVYYSLGNAVSNMSALNTQLELMVDVTVTRDCAGTCTLEEVNHEYLWCSRPGFLCGSYKTIKVKDYLGKRELWLNPSEYSKMKETYKRLHEENHYSRRD